MIEITDALRKITETAVVLPPRRVRLEDAKGRQLQADVVADVDSPPWDRAMMDGFAVSAADFPVIPAQSTEIVELDVAAERAAGDAAGLTVCPGQCIRIMTGAPVPPGTDAIVPIECATDGTATAHAGNRVRLQDPRFQSGQHIARQGDSFRAGETVLLAGHRLAATQIGLAAEAGAHHVVVSTPPRVAIIATGSELVPVGVVPKYGQTRNSNGPMLAAAVNECGAEALPLGLAGDKPEPLRAAIAQGLAADVLLLSGGVSAGDYDLVPGALAAAGVECVFHKVRLKPGKPIWFGVFRRFEASPTLVFGLPGNPVSSLVCFELFVRPALSIAAGQHDATEQRTSFSARLLAPVKGNANRPVYHPCTLTQNADGLMAEPLPWGGSADLLGLSRANGLMLLPTGCGELAVDQVVTVLSSNLLSNQAE